MVPKNCNACGQPLLLENLFVEDGCPCNSPFGVNFKPAPCTSCGVRCARPGHRLPALFGVPVAAAPDPNRAPYLRDLAKRLEKNGIRDESAPLNSIADDLERER